MFGNAGANHATNLPALDNKDIQKLFNQRVASYIIKQFHYSLPLNLFFDITGDVDLCSTIHYLCETDDGAPDMSDSALDAKFKRQTMNPPKIISFSGFCVSGLETKLQVDQLECIKGNSILNDWYNRQLSRAIEKGKDAIMVRFYRMLLSSAHPGNSGNTAGLQTCDQTVGSLSKPVIFDCENADLWFTSILAVIKQMPMGNASDGMFGQSVENAFIFGPPSMEQVLMQTDKYLSYDTVGSCANCALFTDVFTHKPRGIMPITSHCVESYTCQSGGENLTVYPILFGRRYQGAAGQMRVQTKTYMTEDCESVINRTKFYHHGHVFDSRFLGLGHITIATKQPQTVDGCTP